MKSKDRRAITSPLNAVLGGRPAGIPNQSTMDKRIAIKALVDFVHERLQPMLEAMYNKVLDGDVQAFKELTGRAWGSIVQGVEVSGKDGSSIVFMPIELMNKHTLEQKSSNIIDGNNMAKNIETAKDTKIIDVNSESAAK